MDEAIDALTMMQSRTLRRIIAGTLLLLIGIELAIVTTGVWPNIGSAPAGSSCRYWTGFKLVQRPDFDPQHCPLHINRDGSTAREGTEQANSREAW